ncbi:MAG: hypothetical protein JW754_02830 [Candidatus Aenigmarchaeota archaeon]|nr:hypothetical protein [Candidatus Aenigmarchaeota archaeon]
MLEYFGNSTGLKEELEKYRNQLMQIYSDILMDDIHLLDSESKRLLGPSSFTDEKTVRELNKIGTGIFFGGFDDAMFTASTTYDRSLEISSDGRINYQNAITSYPLFSFPEKGFVKEKSRNPNYPSFIAPYIHEYNHFIGFALQNHPLVVAEGILSNIINGDDFPAKLVNKRGNLKLKFKKTTRERRDFAEDMLALLGTMGIFDEAIALRLEDTVLSRLGYDTSKDAVMNEMKKNPAGRLFFSYPIHELARKIKNCHRITFNYQVGNNFIQDFAKIDVVKENIEKLLL